MTSAWRDLTDAEIASWPKAHLGGALLWITIVAGLLALFLLGFALVALFAAREGGMAGFTSAFDGDNPHLARAFVAFVPVLALSVWATLVFCMTLFRARATPVVASAGAALIFSIDVAGTIAGQMMTLSQVGRDFGFQIVILFPLIPRWLGSALMTLGLGGYFLGGARPNAYFLRRVALPGNGALTEPDR